MIVATFPGNLGKDCRVSQVGTQCVCNFPVAAKSGFGDRQQTIWVDCALWGKQAESKLVEYLVSGQGVVVSGQLGTKEHEGKTYLTCRVTDIELAGRKPDSAPAQQAARPAQTVQPARSEQEIDQGDDWGETPF